jgi:hypothetical protein
MASEWINRLGENFEPETWDECVSLLLSSGAEDALYRGQKAFEWSLNSSLERALLKFAEANKPRAYEAMKSMAKDPATDNWARDVEQRLLQRFRLIAMRFEAPENPESWDILGWWELMQHYGTPTRLIDWTTSPFVAIWFALDGHESGDMALWVYDRATAIRNLGEEVAELKGYDSYKFLDDRQLQNKLVDLVLGGSNNTLIPVRPRQFPRVIAQQGAFTVSSNISVARQADEWVRGLLTTRIRLREIWKPDMLAACRTMSLNRRELFRDLDTLGKSIAAEFANGIEVLDY